MRKFIFLAFILTIVSIFFWYSWPGRVSPPTNSKTGELQEQTGTLNGLSITVRALELSPSKQRFQVILDTHAGEIAFDGPKQLVLSVNGSEPTRPTLWRLVKSQSHHVEAEATYTVSATPSATFRLTANANGQSKQFEWKGGE